MLELEELSFTLLMTSRNVGSVSSNNISIVGGGVVGAIMSYRTSSKLSEVIASEIQSYQCLAWSS